ncbi:hypothetical protein ABZ805_15390 [Saccharopolyspora sp. NPDC047091]|uniref:hypothetical protein n=1 Tax=Saccharopolyspora sp. NPDC047091 TaxID=3155924 RepID=UPI0033DF7BDC
MPEVLTDERVAVVLRPFVRATAPLLEVLREADPLRLRGRFADTAADVEVADIAAGTEDAASETTAAAPEIERAEPETAAAREVATASEATTAPDAPTAPETTTAPENPTAPETPTAPENDAADPAETGTGDPTEPGTGARSSSAASADQTAEPGLLDKLLRQLDGMQLPGSSTWDAMSVDERCGWWVQRVGRLVAVAAGLPRFGGALTARLPIRNALGLAGQGMVLSAIAAEHGVTDRGTHVRLIAKVLLDRDLSPEIAAGERGGAPAEEDAKTAELTEELDEARRTGGGRMRAVVRTVWRMARALWEIDSELDKRPQGRFYHEWIGNVPVVGVVGGYLGERSALRRIAKQGARWLRKDAHGSGR